MMDHPGNPVFEGTHTAARGVAEVMAALIMTAQMIRHSQEAIRASTAHRALAEEAWRVRQEERQRAHLATQWRLALDRGWMREATVDEVIQVWAAALPSVEEQVQARRAQRMAEEQLERLDPDLVRRYRDLLLDGRTPVQAMWDARQLPERDLAPAAEPRPTFPRPVGELEAAPEAWEAGPVIAGLLPKGERPELPPAPPWPMGPIGWTDEARAQRTQGETGEDVDRSDRERLAAFSATVRRPGERSFQTSPAAYERGTDTTAASAEAGRARTRRR
jgi:hypothetical protein